MGAGANIWFCLIWYRHVNGRRGDRNTSSQSHLNFLLQILMNLSLWELKYFFWATFDEKKWHRLICFCYFQEFPKAPPCPLSQSLMWRKPPARPLILQAPQNLQSQPTPNPEPPRGKLRWRNELAWATLLLDIFVTRSLSCCGGKLRFLNSNQAICVILVHCS